MGDLYTQIAHHLPNARIATEKQEQVRNDFLILNGFGPPSKSIEDVITYANKFGITHIVIDDVYDERSPELTSVFHKESDYPYLNKVFDSMENDYKKLRVKIFEIDYNKLE